MNKILIETTSRYLALNQINVNEGDETVTIDLNFLTMEDLLNELSYQSLDLFNKHVIVYNSTFFSSASNQDDVNNILLILKKLPNNIHVYFVLDKIDKRKKITKEFINSYKYINLNINYKTIYNYINDYVKENKINMDYNVTSLLVSRFGLKFDIIVNELNKLILFTGNNSNIRYNDALLVLSNNIEDNIFKFISSVINKDYQLSINFLKDLETLKEEETKIIVLLYKEYKTILSYLYYYNQNLTNHEITRKLGIPEWKLKQIISSANHHDENSLINTLLELIKLDESIKKGELDKTLSLKTFIINQI